MEAIGIQAITKEQAIQLYGSGFWETLSYRDRAIFQLHEDLLCMPWQVFHEAMCKALDRAVYTHEFGMNRQGLQKELMGEIPPPSFEEILELIPQDIRTVLVC
jgi:hypothetical protein